MIFFSIIIFIRLKMLKTTHHNYTGFFSSFQFLDSSFFCVGIGAVRSMSPHLTIVLLHLFYILFLLLFLFMCLASLYTQYPQSTHAQFVLINRHRSKWNWNNGILKSDTLLPFHLVIYRFVYSRVYTLCRVFYTHTHTQRGREGGKGQDIRSYWLCAVHSIFLTTSRFVNTLRLICGRMCIVCLCSVSHHTLELRIMCISKLELVHRSR